MVLLNLLFAFIFDNISNALRAGLTGRWQRDPLRARIANRRVSRVAPGETRRTTLGANAPLRVHGVQPRLDAEGEVVGWEGQVVDCAQLRFELGVIADAPELAARALTLGGEVVYSVNTEAFRHQTIVVLGTDELRIPVIVP